MAEQLLDVRDFGYRPGVDDDLGKYLERAIEAAAPLVDAIPWVTADLTPAGRESSGPFLQSELSAAQPPKRPDRLVSAGPMPDPSADPPQNPLAGSDKFTNAYQVTTVLIPRRKDGLPHPMRSQVTIPSNRAIVLRGEGGRSGVAIQNTHDGPLPYFFNVAVGQRPVSIENLVLYGGGVEMGVDTDDLRPLGHGISIERCGFVLAPEWSIIGHGWPTVAVTVADCLFRGSNFGDIFIAQWQSDLWSIRRCGFLESFGTNLKIRSTGTRVVDCNFERRLKPKDKLEFDGIVRGLAAPFVHLDIVDTRQGAHYDSRFTRCRFGNETINTAGGAVPSDVRVGHVPTDIVVFGPIGTMHGYAAVDGATFTDCLFRGRGTQRTEPDEPPPEPRIFSVLALNTPAQNIQFQGCTFFPDGYDWLVREAIITDASMTLLPATPEPGETDDQFDGRREAISDRNSRLLDAPRQCLGNAVSGGPLEFRLGVFSAGGHGWTIHQHDRHHRPGHPDSSIRNAVTDPSFGPLSSWPAQNAKRKQVGGPTDGKDALQVTRGPGKGGASVRRRVSVRTGEPLILSTWARADVPTIIRLMLAVVEPQSPANYLVGDQLPKELQWAYGERDLAFEVGPRWQRYHVQIPAIPPLAIVDPTVPIEELELGPASDVAVDVALLVGPSADDEQAAEHTGQSAVFWGPQLETGWGLPSPFIDSGPTGARVAPHQSVVLGDRIISYANAAPTETEHYAAGDLILADHPQIGGHIGWVAVKSGGIIEFRPWGLIT